MTNSAIYYPPNEPKPSKRGASSSEEQFIFQSIEELGFEVDRIKNNRCRHENYSEGDVMENHFSFDEALELAKSGGFWSEGAKGILSQPMDDPAWKEGPTLELENNITGFAPIVPEYLADIPTCFYNEHETFKPRKQLRIGVQVGRSYYVTNEEAMTRGRAILAGIEWLEESGYDCEVWAIWRNESSSVRANFEVKIKSMGEQYIPAIFAFSLCNTSFQRRLIWRLAEDRISTSIITTEEYGRGVGVKDMKDFDIALGYFNDVEEFRTQERATKEIRKIFNEQVQEFNNNNEGV